MSRLLFVLLLGMCCQAAFAADCSGRPVVVDSLTRQPLAGASVFDRHGRFIGASGSNGRAPWIEAADCPVTIRYIGYEETAVENAVADTVFMQELLTRLPEVEVASRSKTMLHVLAYVREYSTLSTYTDTVAMFREKMVDYMLPVDEKQKRKGWRRPRVLNSKSYYHFTNSNGLDSVSDRCNQHFTWTDWVGMPPPTALPERIARADSGSDTIPGHYGAAEVWSRSGDRVSLNVNVLADTSCRNWVPDLGSFIANNAIDFEHFGLRLRYEDVTEGVVAPSDLAGYSFTIESRGRGRDMFRFHRHDAPFFVTTYTEGYILDKEYITMKEARKWERLKLDVDSILIIEPEEAPELQPAIQLLIDRVNNIDADAVRLTLEPDRRLAQRKIVKRHFGHRVLDLLKAVTGIGQIRAKRNLNRKWNDFKHEQIQKRKSAPPPQ